MNTVPSLEPQEISVDTFLEKYAKGTEKEIPELQHRVAIALASNEADKEYWGPVFYQAQQDGFVPGGRINSAAGMASESTLINCFIQPVGDSVSGYDDDGYPSIYIALGEAAETMRRGGGVGYDFSRIRPFHAYVKGTQSHASGPLSYMRVFDRSCETVESAGGRRGAQMGVLRCDHPDIFSFITAKRTEGEFNNFNLSIGVTDKFMKTVEEKGMWQLTHKAKPSPDYIKENNSYFDEESGKWVWKTIAAQDLWDLVMKSTYDFAEPGILFLDRMNEENNLYYCEVIEATNPCAEQPLPPYGCCDLGSVNLTKFVRNPFTPEAFFDEEAFKNVVRVGIRMLDNVLDVTSWPLEKQRQEAMNKRRIGLGFMGIGDTIIMLNKWYNKADGVQFAEYVSRVMRDTAYRTSIELAKEKGVFPFFDVEKYLAGKFVSRLPEDIRNDIALYGIRNSHLLSIAPTGTIAIAFADNASNGIEPPFSWVYDRKKRMADGSKKTFEVADHAWRLYRAMGHDVKKLPDNFVTALEMTVEAHTDIMKAVQPFIDTSISKCVAKGTPIITNKGILPIETLGNAYIEDTFDKPLDNLKVLCPDGEWRDVTAHYYGGCKKTISIHLSNGQVIEASETHKLMTTEDWVTMPNLKVGDYIKVRRNTKLNYSGNLLLNDIEFNKNSNDYFIPSNMSSQLALFLGMMAADGHLHEEKGMVSITKNNSLIGEYFIKLANTLFGVSDVKHIIDPRNNVHSWCFNSRSICRWITGLIGYRAGDKHIPVEIMSGSKDEMQMFLSGLSLDGYNSGQDSTYIYFGKSKQLALQAFSLLKAIGYNPRLTNKKVDGYDYLVYGVSAKGVNFCLEERKNSENSIDNEFIKIPNEIFDLKLKTTDIGYNTRKGWIARDNVVCREQQYLSNFKDIPDKDFIYYRIERIETGINEIYDIEVKDSHDYLIDGVVSHNTVNIPADYPYDQFKDLYMYAWKSGLKGLATYRPNSILGSVLSVKKEETAVAPVVNEEYDNDNGKTLDQIIDEMYAQPFESRKDGMLPSITIKERFRTNEGEQKFLIIVSFMKIVRKTRFGTITIRRPVEFILEANFGVSSSSWDSAFRMMSVGARYGVPVTKLIENLREITWEHGSVRYGTKLKDGKQVPLWHGSDASAIGYIIEAALIEDGFLTQDGKLAKKYTIATDGNESDAVEVPEVSTVSDTVTVEVKADQDLAPTGRKCPECGAHNLVKRDGCDQCENCGYKGSCG